MIARQHANPGLVALAPPLPDSPSAPGDDPRLVRALEEYLTEAEAGRAPDRSEFLRRHPEIAGELSACLVGLEWARSAADHLGRTATAGDTGRGPRPPDLPPTTCLGDYRIGREIGRGGMGVVYEAEQLSLGRRVALKILPFAAALDPRQLARFKTEAQAAAQLHHTHIVPVFSVGCDRGVHYYAMQFIEGQTLAEVIAALRQDAAATAVLSIASKRTPPVEVEGDEPAASRRDATGSTGPLYSATGRPRARDFARTVARLGVQAAEALEHAHSLGVLHRDIKPANLMVDVRGHLWVTDFGLARLQNDSSLTVTGDLLGTLRYMSPEQALGRRLPIDGRTDLYALGCTLYELLTLRPAFDGQDRSELLRQIAHEEPIAPRRIDPGLPRELETIVLKAMAKDPIDRYASAQELADDLQRFLDDQPIRARRPRLIDRAARWTRRHKSAAAAAAAIVLVTWIALAVNTFVVTRERAAAQAERSKAVAKSRLARDVVDKMYSDVTEKWLALDKNKAGVKREFLEKALGYYEQFAGEAGPDPESIRDAARACLRVGDIQQQLGQWGKAEGAYRRGVALLRPLAVGGEARKRSETQRASARDLAGLYKRLGRMMHATNRDTEAFDLLLQAIALTGEGEAIPDASTQLFRAQCYLDLGDLLDGAGREREAIVEYERALELTRRAAGLAAASGPPGGHAEEVEALSATIQGHLAKASGRDAEAEEAMIRAVIHYERLAKARPTSADHRTRLANAYVKLSWLLATSAAQGVQCSDRAVRMSREAVDLEPHNPHYLLNLGSVQMLAHRGREARATFDRVLALAPDNPNAKNSIAWFLAIGPDPEFRDPKRAVELARSAVEAAPSLGTFWNTLGVALYYAGDLPGATAALEKSMELRDKGDSFDWFVLAMIRRELGDRVQAQHWFNRASEWMDAYRPKDPDLWRFRREALAVLEGKRRPKDDPLPVAPSRPARRVAVPAAPRLPEGGAAARGVTAAAPIASPVGFARPARTSPPATATLPPGLAARGQHLDPSGDAASAIRAPRGPNGEPTLLAPAAHAR